MMRKRYQAGSMILFLLIGMLFSNIGFAETLDSISESENVLAEEGRFAGTNGSVWPVKKLVGKDKVWTVKFNEPVHTDSIKEGNIDVLDFSGKPLKVKREKNRNEIKISPLQNYISGDYQLVIKNLESEKGTKMSRSYVMNFKVLEDCPAGGMAVWLHPSPDYPSFRVSNEKDSEGNLLELGIMVKDSNTNKVIGRIIEIKKEGVEYLVTMDKKCVIDGPVVNNNKQRRLYSFGNARAPLFTVQTSGTPRRSYVAGVATDDYLDAVQPGDLIYNDSSNDPVPPPPPSPSNSSPEMDYVGVVTHVEKREDGEYVVNVDDTGKETPPEPYDPIEEPYTPPVNPIPSPENLRTIDGHMFHTVFIRNGQLYSMGSNSASRSLIPESLNWNGSFEQIAADSDACIALASNGKAYRYVQGKGVVDIQEDNPKFAEMDIKQVASGSGFYLVLNSRGEVWRHGDNSYFGMDKRRGATLMTDQAEMAATESVEEETLIDEGEDRRFAIEVSKPSEAPADLPGQAKQVDAIGKVALAVMDNGDLYMWGKNDNGQIDPRKPSGLAIKKPVKVEGLSGWIEMAQTDGERTAVLMKDGSVYFWGKNWSGVGNTGRIIHIDGLSDIVKIAIKKQHMLALRRDGSVFSIGSNGFGELGVGNAAPHKDKVFKVDFNGAVIKDIGVGDNTSYAVSEDNKLWVWGNNINGQLGLGRRGDSAHVYYPVLVNSIEQMEDFVIIN